MKLPPDSLNVAERASLRDAAHRVRPRRQHRPGLDPERAARRRAAARPRAVVRAQQGRPRAAQAIADMAGVEPHQVQITTGAAEALWILFMLAAEPARTRSSRHDRAFRPSRRHRERSAWRSLVHERAGRPRRPQHPPDPPQPAAQPDRRRDVRRRPRPAPTPSRPSAGSSSSWTRCSTHLPRPRPVLRHPARARPWWATSRRPSA